MKKELLKEYKAITRDFFDIDDENKIAHLRLEYQKASDIFSQEAATKLPIYSEDFFDWIENFLLYYAPSGYKIHLDVAFDDLEGYTEGEMKEIFRKNILLETRRSKNISRTNNYIAYSLFAVGFVLLVAMATLLHYWNDGSVVREIVRYLLDILTMVIVWEAIAILVIDNKKRRDFKRNFALKYEKVSFYEKKEKKKA